MITPDTSKFIFTEMKNKKCTDCSEPKDRKIASTLVLATKTISRMLPYLQKLKSPLFA